MTLSRLADLSAYWKQHPPVHIVVANMAVAFGMKPKTESSDKLDVSGNSPKFATLPEYEEGAGDNGKQ